MWPLHLEILENLYMLSARAVFMAQYIATNHNGTPIMRAFSTKAKASAEAEEYQWHTGNGTMIWTKEEFYSTDMITDSQRRWVE